MIAQDAARRAVARAVAGGALPVVHTLRCTVCTFPAAVYHHWSYLAEHQLDVVPLCDRCHSWVHAGRIPDPRSGAILGRRPPAIDPGDRGACPWPPPPPESVESRLRRVDTFRAVAHELRSGTLDDVFAEAERRLAAERT